MKEKYEKIIAFLSRASYKASVALKSFNEYDQEIVNEIITHNKACEKNPSHNNINFWNEILEKSYETEPVLYAVAISPYVPDEIIKKIAVISTSPETLLEILKKDIQLDDSTYDRIQKIAKKEICETLKEHYEKINKETIPFNQHAIDYYAKKTFNKSNVKNDKMLITLAYAKDRDFLINCPFSSKLNEARLNYLIDNKNIPEETRDEMFIGIGFNADDITPDYDAIRRPTNFMINEIYRLNSEGYFVSNDKSVKKQIIGKIINLIYANLTTEGIEKDIINKYEKGDSNYRYLIKTLLAHTKNMSTIEHAHTLDYRIFDNAFKNPNLADTIIEKYGISHMDKITAYIKRTGNMPSCWGWGKIITKTQLGKKQYDTMLASKNPYLYNAMAISPNTPEDILQKILNTPLKHSCEGNTLPSINLATDLNLEMRKGKFSDSEIRNWCTAFSNHLPVSFYVESNKSKTPIDLMRNLLLSNRLDDFEKIVLTLSEKYDNANEQTGFSTFFKIKSNLIDSIKNHTEENIENKTLSSLYDRRQNLYRPFLHPPTLGNIYIQLNAHGDELIEVCEEIDKRQELSNNIYK